ncbi:MAG TPA: aspartate/glutamate racemase family protein [Ktedonobacteraceae bacterium]|nr:aspartate/glutamate racemase family protein [Ktedonobacteraceae bacterium]
MQEKKTVAIIHTSFVFVNVEPVIKQMFTEILPDVRIINIVDDTLLSDVVEAGEITPGVVQRMTNHVQSAEQANADLIFSACSSLGPALDIAKETAHVPVVKVDEAMAEKAVELGPRIGILATVPTTLAPTEQLILDTARRMNVQVTTTKSLAEGAFALLMGGQREQHNQRVLAQAQKLAQSVDVIVLAQASMAYLAASVEEQIGKPVLSSPRLGVERVREKLAAQILSKK